MFGKHIWLLCSERCIYGKKKSGVDMYPEEEKSKKILWLLALEG